MKNNPVFADSQIVDVTNPLQTKEGFAASLAALGDIDGVIANAGVNGPTKPLWDYSLSEWQMVMSVDLTGVFLTVQAALGHLREQERGRIIIISSIAGKEGNRCRALWRSKSRRHRTCEGLARELLPSEITVNCIAPSMAMTDLLDEMSAEYIADKKSRIPMGRLCTPEEIASVAAFIASPACSFTTGQIFDVTGGRATW